MSCIFVITPIVITAWPVLVAVASSAATSLGYRIVSSALEEEGKTKAIGQSERSVSLEVENSEVLAEQLRRGESMAIAKDDIKIVISLDALGKITAHVQGGNNCSTDELQKAGQEFLNHLIQQYAYQQVMLTMKEKGFSLVEENVGPDGLIRMKVRKFE
jgi:hypothetical protein